MNRPSFERFAPDVKKGGTIIVDASAGVTESSAPEGVRLVVWPAIAMAEEFGVPKAANTMMLAALKKLGLTQLSPSSLEAALVASFKKKPALGEKNKALLRMAEDKMS
jgi:Pyruvate/2-oxoacid:ferredoxin oxidoreductase gamma subunit